MYLDCVGIYSGRKSEKIYQTLLKNLIHIILCKSNKVYIKHCLKDLFTYNVSLARKLLETSN